MSVDNSNEEVDAPASGAEHRPRRDHEPAIMAFLFWAFVGVFVLAANWDTFWPWINTKKGPALAIGGLLLVILIGFAVRWLWKSSNGQIGSIILTGVPLVTLMIGGVWIVTPEFRVSILRCVFLVIVIFLPALLYYLFVALRRISLLQEYYTNLAKLGLLKRRTGAARETEHNRRIRVISYLQRFEAIYGVIPETLVRQITNLPRDETLSEARSDHSRGSRETTGEKFQEPDFDLYQPGLLTPEAIPVVLATLLIGLGWLLVLPPWEQGESLTMVLKPTEDATIFAFLGGIFLFAANAFSPVCQT